MDEFTDSVAGTSGRDLMKGRDDSARGLLQERLLEFAVRIIRVVRSLPNDVVGTHIAKQVLRSGTSAGANYGEACGAESRPDFLHKMQIVLKELRETRYWLQVAASTNLLPEKRLDAILQESDELISMTVRSLVTARKGSRRAPGS
jgi:four helix bundle protein